MNWREGRRNGKYLKIRNLNCRNQLCFRLGVMDCLRSDKLGFLAHYGQMAPGTIFNCCRFGITMGKNMQGRGFRQHQKCQKQ